MEYLIRTTLRGRHLSRPRVLLLVIISGLCLFPALFWLSVNSSDTKFLVVWKPPRLYVRERLPGHDKVWRVQAGDDGVVDLYGERLIPTITPDFLTLAAYSRFSDILRYGGDEAPVVFVNGRHPVGGNHTPAGDYKRSMSVDQTPIERPGWYRGNDIAIHERYTIAEGAIEIDRSFEAGFMRFSFAITPSAALDAAIGGVQLQRLPTEPDESTTLVAPGLSIDITEPKELSVGRELWKDDQLPSRFDLVRTAPDGPTSDCAIGYDPGDRGQLTELLHISQFGKIYPFGFQGKMPAGVRRAVTGYLGCSAAE